MYCIVFVTIFCVWKLYILDGKKWKYLLNGWTEYIYLGWISFYQHVLRNISPSKNEVNRTVCLQMEVNKLKQPSNIWSRHHLGGDATAQLVILFVNLLYWTIYYCIFLGLGSRHFELSKRWNVYSVLLLWYFIVS